MLNRISSLFRKRTQPDEPKWHGEFLSEDQIIADVLAKVKADPEGLKRWCDPASWTLNFSRVPYWWRCTRHDAVFECKKRCIKCIATNQSCPAEPHQPDYEGCLHWAGMSIRNYYGLWREGNPYTLVDPSPNAQGIIDHPLYPDNLSGRVIDRVRKALEDA